MKYFGFWHQISTHTSKAQIKAEPKEKNEMFWLYRLHSNFGSECKEKLL